MGWNRSLPGPSGAWRPRARVPLRVTTSDLTAEGRVRLAQEVELTRKALTRCRRFGFALSDFVRIGLTAQGLDENYGRSGSSVNADLRSIYRTA